MNKMIKRSLGLLLGAGILASPFLVQTFAEEGISGLLGSTGKTQLTDQIGYMTGVIEAPRIVPDGTVNANGLDTDGNCALNDGNYVEYIDRVDVPQWSIDFYNLLKEGSDNDGENDFLINGQTDDGDTTIVAMTIPNVTEDELKDQNSDFWSVYNENWAYYRALYQAFDRDCPEVFWIRRLYFTDDLIADDNGETYHLIMYLNIPKCFDSHYTSETAKEDIVIRDNTVKEILAEAPGEDAYKVKYFNDWLTYHNEYNTLVANDIIDGVANETWECISALKGQTGETGPVCEAYARALKVLCDASDIPCVLVSDSEHMWNYVEIGDTWYAVDVTWNDPVKANKQAVGAVSGMERNTYTLVGGDSVQSGKTFLTSHPVTNQWYTNGTSFTNGPELNSASFDWTTHVHTETEAVKENDTAPTCVKAGHYDAVVYCWGCGAEISRTTVTTDAALGHDYSLTETIPATGYEEGSYTYTCSRCGSTFSRTIARLTLEIPALDESTATVPTQSSDESQSTVRKITFTGSVGEDNANSPDDYYDILEHGIVYIAKSRLGSGELNLETSGRTKVTFTEYREDGSFSYTIHPASASTEYVMRSFVTYLNADKNEVTVYSDPITCTFNELQ